MSNYLVYKTFHRHKADIVKAVLIDHNIKAVILDKQISVYPIFNSSSPIEVFVDNNCVIEAKHLIEKHNL